MSLFWKKKEPVVVNNSLSVNVNKGLELKRLQQEMIDDCQKEVDEWLKTAKNWEVIVTLKDGTELKQEFKPAGYVYKDYDYDFGRRGIDGTLKRCYAQKNEAEWLARQHIDNHIHQQYFVINGEYIKNDEIKKIQYKVVP